MTSLGVPLEPANCGSTRQLFEEIHDFLAQHPGLEEKSVQKVTYFTFAVSFLECAPVWPFLSVTAPDAAASSLFLRMLECVFIRSLHVGEVTLAGLISLPRSPTPIFLIDQSAATKKLERVLCVMGRPRAGVISKGEIREIFGPVVVCAAEPIHHPWLLDQAIQVALTPSRSRLPRFNQQLLDETSQRLRGKLLYYRERNLAKVCESQFDAPEFCSMTREIAALLGSSIVDDTELQSGVIPLLKSQDGDARTRRENLPQAVVIEAGLFLCHERDRTEALVGEFATIADGILKGRGENIHLEPRAVGDLLRSKELFPQRLGRAGRGIRLYKDIRRRFHELAWAFDVRARFRMVWIAVSSARKPGRDLAIRKGQPFSCVHVVHVMLVIFEFQEDT